VPVAANDAYRFEPFRVQIRAFSFEDATAKTLAQLELLGAVVLVTMAVCLVLSPLAICLDHAHEEMEEEAAAAFKQIGEEATAAELLQKGGPIQAQEGADEAEKEPTRTHNLIIPSNL
jgi:hypothetical protein